jgi:hypothetical protein
MMSALVHVAALLAIMQAPVIVLPKDTCRIDPKSLAGTTIELVSDFAPFVQQTYDADFKYVFFSHGMSVSGRWFVRKTQICTETSSYVGCGEFRSDKASGIFIVDKDGKVAKYLQRSGGRIKCR